MCGQSQHQPSVHEQGFVVLQPKARCDPASFFLGWPLFFDAPHRQSRLHSTHFSLALLVGRPHIRPSREMAERRLTLQLVIQHSLPHPIQSHWTLPRETPTMCATVAANRRSEPSARPKVGWLAAPAVQSLPRAPLTGRAPLEGSLPTA